MVAPQLILLQPLRSTREVYANVIWRFLQMRGYLDLKHQLTTWGVFLESTLKALGSDPSKEQVEAAFIGVELLRFDLLNANTMFENFSGSPTHGSRKFPFHLTGRHKVMISSN
jgi:hypothetical protein